MEKKEIDLANPPKEYKKACEKALELSIQDQKDILNKYRNAKQFIKAISKMDKKYRDYIIHELKKYDT